MGLQDGLEPDNVRVVQLVEHCHFAVGPLGVDLILEGVEDLLEGVLLASVFVDYFPDVPVGSAAEELPDFEEGQDMTLYFFAHITNPIEQ